MLKGINKPVLKGVFIVIGCLLLVTSFTLGCVSLSYRSIYIEFTQGKCFVYSTSVENYECDRYLVGCSSGFDITWNVQYIHNDIYFNSTISESYKKGEHQKQITIGNTYDCFFNNYYNILSWQIPYQYVEWRQLAIVSIVMCILGIIFVLLVRCF